MPLSEAFNPQLLGFMDCILFLLVSNLGWECLMWKFSSSFSKPFSSFLSRSHCFSSSHTFSDYCIKCAWAHHFWSSSIFFSTSSSITSFQHTLLKDRCNVQGFSHQRAKLFSCIITLLDLIVVGMHLHFTSGIFCCFKSFIKQNMVKKAST